MYRKAIKRLLDIIFSFFGILALGLPMLLIAALVKIDSKGPALFKQKRVGINKKHFYILKFRSMPVDIPNDIPTHELKDPSALLSPFQRFIRRSSIDELPQLFNILAGHMSIIGPRPALWNQYDLIAERDKYGANDVLPGLTGWAQINGRDELLIAEKAKLDGEYVEKLSLLFDCKCFLLTVISVIKSEGVVEGGTGNISDDEENTKEKQREFSEK